MLVIDVSDPLSSGAEIPAYSSFCTIVMMNSNYRKVLKPVWQFLNQPLFNKQQPAVLNPRRFWHTYRIQHLEKCLSRTYRPEEYLR